MTTPIIYANGKDDDLPGLIAAAKNEAVRVGDKMYWPGDSLILAHKTLAVSVDSLMFLGPDEPDAPYAHYDLVVRTVPNCREIAFLHCEFLMGRRPLQG